MNQPVGQFRKDITHQGNIAECIYMHTAAGLVLSVISNITLKASEVVAVITRYIVPGISLPGTKSMHAVFIFQAIWLISCPEPETV